MNRQHVRPVFADIQDGDCQLPAMVGYIRQLVDSQDSRAVAHNAATAYLALIVAFSDRGLLEVAWAPRLLIEVDNQEFEVSQDSSPSRHASHLTSHRSSWMIKKWLRRRSPLVLPTEYHTR
jgi:hypothetical protein